MAANTRSFFRAASGVFNTALFSRTFSTQFVNLRADYASNWDLALIKNTPIREQVRIEYRCEAFNATNRANFAAPNVSPTSSSFGRVTSPANRERRIQMSPRLLW